ncbi:lignostilbene-alpha,beta-dioxygenase isozyme III [Dactylonectria macrodidyma]|uniref:Lignostilbene-alpha,beta-dioxygenase isozyme III n=1 Tax=Dactylonectria macrodidyma TaxID=307937 RepID=A0A9P9DXG8_9HYPO|nr:lignostilbene-alpha,beta-dioxygenase isozyme III [Dactylonectria macrodidyma]
MASNVLATPDRSAYIHGRLATTQTEFPKTPAFSKAFVPTRYEASIQEVETQGVIPNVINGTYFSMQVDHHMPPRFEDDLLFNGDGVVSAFRIVNGHVDWKRRYVQTDRFKLESEARRSLFGRYRNPYTDHESVRGVVRTAANTNIIFWRGVMLAMKEDGPPFALDPTTLETLGRYDFEGQVLSPVFSAHPKIDPASGEMLAFGYQAGGDGNCASRELVYYVIDADGKKTHEAWFEMPYAGYIHDFAFTDDWIIFPLTPLKASLERIKQGGNYWAWDPEDYGYFGIAPRHKPKRGDITWIRTENCFQGHIAGTYQTDDNKLVFDLSMASDNVFWWFPQEGKAPERRPMTSPMSRYVFDLEDLSAVDMIEPTQTVHKMVEFARIDDRFLGKPYRHYWAVGSDASKHYDFERCGPPSTGIWNMLIGYDWETGREQSWYVGPTSTLEEPCFIPASTTSPEGSGYLVAVIDRLDEMRQDLAVFNAQELSAGPIGLIRLPLRPRRGFHGNFVDHADIEAFASRRAKHGDLGPAKAAEKPLPWQLDIQKI